MTTNIKIAALVALFGVFSAFSSPSALAEGNAERGKPLAYTCLGCHGIEGYRNAYPSYRVPRLGGQKAAYIELAVKGYRDGTRKHPTMEAQAVSLSDQDIADVAAYLATLNAESVAAGGTETDGIDATATCAACHGANGISSNPLWPTLAGQHEEYLVAALNQYRDGTRTDPSMSPMAAPLTDDDVALLARYFSRLKGLETTLPE